jgi:hypothetical protein
MAAILNALLLAFDESGIGSMTLAFEWPQHEFLGGEGPTW